MSNLLVSVLRRDITLGKSCDNTACPVARALLRALKKFNPTRKWRVSVCHHYVTIGEFTKPSETYLNRDYAIANAETHLVPQKLTNWIAAFDDTAPENRLKLKPIQFVVRMRSGKYRPRKKKVSVS